MITLADFSGIYMIKNSVTKKVYIGQSIHVRERIKKHLWELKNNKHRNIHLQNAFNKYGIDSFLFGIVEKCPECNLNEAEVFWISFYHSTSEEKGYNLLDGGGNNYHHSEESKQKISLSLMGHSVTEAAREKMLESQKLFWQSDKGTKKKEEIAKRLKEYYAEHPEVARAHSKYLKEYYKLHPVSKETKIKLSKAQKKRYENPEEREKQSERSRKAMDNPETRRKLSEANKGKKISAETRRKIKEANKDQQKRVLCVELDIIFPSIHDAARALNMSPGHIPDCCKGKRNTAGGYHWAYIDEHSLSIK